MTKIAFILFGQIPRGTHPQKCTYLVFAPRSIHTERLPHRHRNKRYVNGAQLILPITVRVIGAARQRYGDADGVIWCD